MPILAKDNGQDFEKPNTGMQNAICSHVSDVGTHEVSFQNGPKKLLHKVMFCFELEQKLTQGKFAGQPFMLARTYTLSLFDKSNLAKDLESWFSKKLSEEQRKDGIDLERFIGRQCTLNLVESDDGKYVNIAGVLPAMPGAPKIDIFNKTEPKRVVNMRAKSIEAQQENGSDGSHLPDDNYSESDVLPF
jgi:hypothetical protein